MLKRYPIFPFLFALYVILNLLVTNQEQIPAWQALPSSGVLLASTMGIFLGMYVLFRDWHYAAYATFLSLVFFFLFGHLDSLLESVISIRPVFSMLGLLLWTGVLLALAPRRVWRRFGGGNTVTPTLNLVLAIALASQGLWGTIKWVRSEPDPTNSSASQYLPVMEEESPSLDCSYRRDIYYIVLDGYGRADVLNNLYGVDTSGFLAFLQQKGFYLAGQSHANYTQTVFSIPSGLNFTYLEAEPEGVNGTDYFSELFAKNRLMHLLKQCGYKSIAFETGFYFTDHPNVDVYLSKGKPLDEFAGLMLSGSPFDMVDEMLFARPVMNDYEAHRARVRYVFNRLKTLPSMPGPKIVFAHVVSPHPPFVFDAAGRPVEPTREYKIADGDDYSGDRQEYQKAYAAQVKFVNDQLQGVVEAILSRSKKPPIIILQGDHGPGGWLDWDSPSSSCLWERTGILNAYYLPGRGKDRLYPQISPVNSFRVILDTYFDANLELLPDHTYFTSHRLTRQVLNITEVRDSTQNCPLP